MKHLRPLQQTNDFVGSLFNWSVQRDAKTSNVCAAAHEEPDICRNRHVGAPTSVAAHKRIRGALSARREAVYDVIKSWSSVFPHGGITVDELASDWNVTPNSISGRFSELHKAGRICKSGTRLTRSGCKAAVWVAI